jgi:hypothetical protein
MKNIITSFLIASIIYLTNITQSKAQETAKFQFKKGLYKDFESFRNNKPTADLTFAVESKQRNIGGFLSSDVISLYKLNITAKDKESVGPVFGFCDGTSFYFNKGIYNPDTYNYYNPRSDFFKMENYGRFTVYKALGSSYSPTFTMGAGGAMMPEASSVRTKVIMIIDMKTGNVRPLDRKALVEILEDDEELSELFDKDKNKRTLVLDYLLWYNKKHPFYSQQEIIN